MRKIPIFMLFVLFPLWVFAGQVTDNNNGNVGDILISTGKNQGQNSEGTWTDSSYFKGEQGVAGQDGLNGKDGQNIKGERGYTGKGLKDRHEAQLEIRIADTKHTTWAVYGGYDFNNGISFVGGKCTIKLGKSYLEKKIEELERRLK